MSAIDSSPLLSEPALVPAERGASWTARLERALTWLGERMNPILVKECRQALKSKQFTITFGLLLLCAWGWSILGVALYGPDIYYSAAGADLFYGYYLVLAFPLTIIVPYVAFRSLAGEVEDRTYELVSITTLKPRQIVGGKLGSALVQMVVYFSAMSPCLAFTYMLRGIDVVTIAFMLYYTFLISLLLSTASLMLATITSERHWQIVLSVALVLGLAGAFFATCGFGALALSEFTLSFDDWEFWVANGGISILGFSYAAMFYFAAASQLTFATDNRSTPLRVVMVVQHVLFTGWIAWLCTHLATRSFNDLFDMFYVYLTFVGLHWFAMGTLMIGESPQLSSRVKRNLPQSFLGRIFLTWFNPGPGTGYTFALVNLVAAMLMVAAGELVWVSANAAAGGTVAGQVEQLFYFATVGFCYVAIYLGVGRLILMAAQRVVQVTLPLAVLLEILMLMLGCGVPLIIYWMSELRLSGYSLLHASNPVFSLVHIVDRTGVPAEAPALLLILAPLAGLVILLNFPAVIKEVRAVRIAKPKRVAEEDAQLEALLHPVELKPKSPWD